MKTKLNEQLRAGLAAATGALFALDDQGVTAHYIEVEGGQPVIRVDRAPPVAAPGLMITRTVGTRRETLYTVVILGCKVQWLAPAAAAARGAA